MEVLRDAAAIIGDELVALADEGVAYVQLDNPHYPDYISEERREQWRALGVDPDQALRQVRLDNGTPPAVSSRSASFRMARPSFSGSSPPNRVSSNLKTCCGDVSTRLPDTCRWR